MPSSVCYYDKDFYPDLLEFDREIVSDIGAPLSYSRLPIRMLIMLFAFKRFEDVALLTLIVLSCLPS